HDAEAPFPYTTLFRSMANTTAAEATIAGVSKGKRTLLNATNGEAPRSAAASSYCLPIENSRPRTITTTKEIEKVTWPRIWATVRSEEHTSELQSRSDL